MTQIFFKNPSFISINDNRREDVDVDVDMGIDVDKASS
jgi:hypothetical protein